MNKDPSTNERGHAFCNECNDYTYHYLDPGVKCPVCLACKRKRQTESFAFSIHDFTKISNNRLVKRLAKLGMIEGMATA